MWKGPHVQKPHRPSALRWAVDDATAGCCSKMDGDVSTFAKACSRGRRQLDRLLVVVALLSACARASDDDRRVFTAVHWDTLHVLRGSTHPVLSFALPRILTARESRLYIYDFSRHRVFAFDSSGHSLWVFPQDSLKRDRLGNVTDLQVAPNGEIWAVDAGRGSLEVLSSDGSLVSSVVSKERIRRVIPSLSRNDEFAAVILGGSSPWALVDVSGQGRAVGRYPDSVVANAPPYARIPLVGMDASEHRWAAAYPFGDRFYVYRDTALICSGRFISNASFPVTAARGHRTAFAASLAFRDSSIYILAAGKGAARLRVIDVYSARSCSYERSLRIPGRALSMTIAGSIFYFESEWPDIAVVAVRAHF